MARLVLDSRPRSAAVFVLIALLLGACAPAQAPRGAPAVPLVEKPVAPNRVTIAIGAEVTSLASKLEPQRTYGGEYGWISNSPLAVRDERGTALPLLAAELPSRDARTWVVKPDGTMATTWRIRPNARWHDGQPVSGRDLAFAFAVYRHPSVPIREREPERFIDRVEPMDEKTFVIHWKQPYPRADALTNRELEPLPDHLMGRVFEAGDVDVFLNHAFWTSTSYVGSGPYRIVQWEPGAQLVFRAFDEFFLGKPKIDEVVLRIIPDPNTLVSNLLAGTVDVTLGATLGQGSGANVQRQWAQSGDGQVLTYPARLRYVQIQFDPARNQTPALFDVRVRRAMVSGIDRETLAHTASEGFATAADVMMATTDPLYPRAQQAFAKYPYDPARAAALLQEAGWPRRGAEGALANAAGQPLMLDIRTTQGRDSELEMNIMGADLSRLGMQMTQSIVPQSRISDVEFRVTFPGLNVTAVPLDIPASMNVAHGDQCATVERRYVGANRGCWKNAEYDRLYIVASTSLDPAERDASVVEALKIMTEEVGIFGIAYAPETIAVRKGLLGPGPHWPPQVGTTWNMYLWSWAQ